MAKKKRAGLKSASALQSTNTIGQSSRHVGGMGGRSTHSAVSTRSGFGKSGHSVASATKWEDDDDARSTRSGMSAGRPTLGERPRLGDKQKSAAMGVSMRDMMSKATSVASGLSGASTHSGHKLSHKQKKARPGLAVMPAHVQSQLQMQSTRTGLSRANSGLSLGSGHSGHSKKIRRGGTSPNNSSHSPKRQMSMRSLDSGKSGKSKRSLTSQHSKRSLKSNKSGMSTRSGMTSPPASGSGHKKGGSRHAPSPPGDDGSYGSDFSEEYEEDMEEFDEEEYYDDSVMPEEETVITMPQTEEDIRQGLHTEQVTKGFFRKKVRSIKWYSADIDKVDAGNYEPGETIEEGSEGSGSEYETDTEDSEEEPVIPDPWYIALGRGLLLLEKKGEEVTPIKRWLRFLTWMTFVCDATAAIVSLVQFSEVQTCCDEPILNLGGINMDWSTIIRYAVIFYLILILLEVYPVLRRGFPFNIVNPLIGFLITFALFFDDSYMEAMIMWCIETMAVLCEFACYRVKIRQVNMRAIEIKKLMPKTTKKKEAFEDEDTYLKELHKARRRYYVLKQEQRMDQRLLQWLHLAVYMNLVMSSIVLMLILVIARNGGLCIEDFDYPNPFTSDQLSRCNHCTDPNVFDPTIHEKCEYCDPLTGTYQCYFPYS